MAGDKMYSKISIWTEDGHGMWHGICKECKGEKAQYTPEGLKKAGIKPCQTCTDLVRYEAASAHVEQSN